MQVGAPLVLDLAEACNISVVVEDFGRKKVDLARKQQANNEGSHPEHLPGFFGLSHSKVAFRWLGLILSSNSLPLYRITFQ